MLRKVEYESKDEVWFFVGGQKLRFGIEEFLLLTGLKCHGDPTSSSTMTFHRGLMGRYFADLNTIHKLSLLEFVKTKRCEPNEDVVNIGILFLIHWYILHSRRDIPLNRFNFDVMEFSLYKEYPWGHIAFDNFLRSVKGKLKKKMEEKYGNMKNFTYRLDGFPIAFQMWFYECSSKAEGLCASKFYNKIPRNLNLGCDHSTNCQSLEKENF